MSEEEEYVVEHIRNWRYNLKKKQKEYHIKWQNYPEEENTWEPEEYLSCPDILKKFVSSLHGKQKRYYYTEDLTQLNGFQRNAEYIAIVGARDPTERELLKERSPTFYLLVLFRDNPEPEPISLQKFHKYRPDDAFKFCEDRILVRKE